jgi:hypothetical protein
MKRNRHRTRPYADTWQKAQGETKMPKAVAWSAPDQQITCHGSSKVQLGTATTITGASYDDGVGGNGLDKIEALRI